MKLIIKKDYFLLLFYLIPISIVFGPSISLLNIILIDLSFLFFVIKFRLNLFNNQAFKLISILYFYLIFNSLIAINHEITLSRNIGFIRFIIFFVSINYIFKFFDTKKIFYFWGFIILFFSFDVFLEFFSGSNLLGWGASEINGVPQAHSDRIVSFFKDEPVAGAFLSGFILIIFGFLIDNPKISKVVPLIFLLFTSAAILLTGERSNSIKIFIAIFFFIILLNSIKAKTKLIIFLTILLILAFSFNQSNYIKKRYYNQFLFHFSSLENFKKYLNESNYFILYKSGINVFKNYPILGVGNKNYRIETCNNFSDKINQKNYICQTHPHQIYIELLSEHGVIGSIILLGILFSLMFKILQNIRKSKNYIQIGSFLYILISFIPLLPSGSFFSDFNSTIFWINFSIMFACDKKTNIFYKNEK